MDLNCRWPTFTEIFFAADRKMFQNLAEVNPAISKLTLIKISHTLIWLFFNVVIFYLLYAVIIGRIDKWVWICLGLIVLEGIVLVIFKNVCPVTKVAQRYSNSNKANFDIYLPEWLARYNKQIYTSIVLVALVILVWRLA